MNRLAVFGSTMLILTVAGSGAPQDAKRVRIETLNTRDTVYHVSDGGGNDLVLIDERSGAVVLIDGKRPGWGPPLLEAIQAVTDLPVRTIINTHAHDDHTGTNPEITSAVEIVAHENTKANMARMDAFKGANARFLPNRTFKDRLTLLDDSSHLAVARPTSAESRGEEVNRIDLYYFGSAHTNGDIIVVFPAKGLAHVGDLFAERAAPVIDTLNGGSGLAYPATLARAVAEIKGVTRVITGHVSRPDPGPGRGQGNTWADFQEYADFTRDFVAAVKEAFTAGKTVDQAVATLKLPDRYQGYNMTRARSAIEVIYGELKK